MELKVVPKNDRLCRWCIIDVSATGKGKPIVADNIRTEETAALLASATQLREALAEAHRIILHELDNGRTPYLLPVDNGGKGLGYFEDVLAGLTTDRR